MNKFTAILQKMFAMEPQVVNGQDSLMSNYYRNQVINMIFARFKIDGIPDWWSRNYFYKVLFLEGYIGITDVAEFGVTGLRCSFTGENMFDEPTRLHFVVNTHPSLDFYKTIGGTQADDAALVQMSSFLGVNYSTMADVYAYKLAACDAGIDMNIMNTKVAWVFRASNEGEKKSIDAALDSINKGKPAVIVGSKVPIEPSTFPVKSNYIAQDLQILKRSIRNELLTDLGINNANTDKKERLNSDEVNSNNEEIKINVQEVLTNVQRGFDRANYLFDLNLKISLRTWDEMKRELGITDAKEDGNERD